MLWLEPLSLEPIDTNHELLDTVRCLLMAGFSILIHISRRVYCHVHILMKSKARGKSE